MSDQSVLLPKWLTHGVVDFGKRTFGYSYTFWAMPILIFSPVANFGQQSLSGNLQWFFFFYLTFGFSAKITLTPGTVLGLIYGGNTAMGGKPAGTRSIATLSVWGLAPPPAVGGAPPPGLPGGMFPRITSMFLFFVIAKAQKYI